MTDAASTFDALFTADEDPWKFKTRWYEERKRALTLACLPQRRYASGYEPGCANGELSAALATRCDRLLVTDGSAKAVALARDRLAGQPHVQVRQAWVPAEWPTDHFDLIVISELGYFLDTAAMTALAACARQALAPGGTLLACHWHRPPEGFELNGDTVHDMLTEALPVPHVGHYRDDDFRIDLWCADGRSVAQREGFA